MPTSTRTGHVQFDGTLRQICNCPTGGQRRPPLQKILRFCRRLYILWVRLAGRGRTPPLRQRGVNFTDSHWWVRLCRVVLHNPFVTASPCHLPLHKGGFGWCKRVTSQNVQPFSSSVSLREPPSPHGEGFGVRLGWKSVQKSARSLFCGRIFYTFMRTSY